jgi:hypothetical protein
MSLYHFHLSDVSDFSDLNGTEFSGVAEAKQEALRYAGAVIKEADDRIWNSDWSMRVTDGEGATLFTLRVIACDGAAVPTE